MDSIIVSSLQITQGTVLKLSFGRLNLNPKFKQLVFGQVTGRQLSTKLTREN